MINKEYKSYRQLLIILRRRGVVIPKGSSGSKAMRILETENYYNVINGYKDLFLATPSKENTEESYKTGTTFNEIYALYCFDRELREIYLKYILRLENQFKTILSHEFSEKYGHDNYLKLSSFNTEPSTESRVLKSVAIKNHLRLPDDLTKTKECSKQENIASATKLIGDIQQEVARQINKNHQVVTHYMAKYGYIPLWVLVNVLSFGRITSFYCNLRDADRKTISKRMHLDDRELYKYMNILGLTRNKCAHDERLFDIRFKQNIKTNNIKNFSTITLPKDSKGNFLYGINDAFSVAVIFSQLLTLSEIKEFSSSMKSCINKLSKSLKAISIEDVLCKMGYPSNWSDIVKLSPVKKAKLHST